MSLSEEWLQALTTGFNNRYVMVRHGQSEANVQHLVSSIFSVSVANHGLTELGIEQAINAANTFIDIMTITQPDEDLLGTKIVKPKINDIVFNPLDMSNIVFYTSDFKRAYETAHYMKESLILYNQDEIKKEELKQQTYTPAFIAEDSNINKNMIMKKDQKDTKITIKKPFPFYTTISLRERYFGVFEGAEDTIYEQIWSLDKSEEVDNEHHGAESIQSVVTRTTEFILELEQIWKGKIIILVAHGDITQIMQATFAAIDPRFHRSLPKMANCEVRELLLAKNE